MKQDVLFPQLEKADRRLLEQFVTLLSQSEKSLTDEELAIAKSLLRLKHHTDFQEALKAVSNETSQSVERVENVLQTLQDYGILQIHSVEGQESIEHNHTDRRHFHLVCMKTSRIQEFTSDLLEEVMQETAARYGFLPVFSDVVIYGIEDEYLKSGQRGFRLKNAVQNQIVELLDLPDGDTTLKQRASKIGLAKGSVFEVLQEVSSTGEVLCQFETHRLVFSATSAAETHIRALDAKGARQYRERQSSLRRQPLSLLSLKPGEETRVLGTRTGSVLQRRLMELGFIAGARVQRMHTAPLGDPVEFQVGQSRVSLRRVEADDVFVERDA